MCRFHTAGHLPFMARPGQEGQRIGQGEAGKKGNLNDRDGRGRQANDRGLTRAHRSQRQPVNNGKVLNLGTVYTVLLDSISVRETVLRYNLAANLSTNFM